MQGVFSKADARNRFAGLPKPEAAREIWDVLAAVDKLPHHLVARGHYKEVGRKPRGDKFIAVQVREFHGPVVRPFESSGFDIGVNVFIASRYADQTLETLAVPGEVTPFERITGFPRNSASRTTPGASWNLTIRTCRRLQVLFRQGQLV